MIHPAIRPYLEFARNWALQFIDPLRILRATSEAPRYFLEWYRYSHMQGAERIRLIDSHPQLHDRTKTTAYDAHYFHMSNWAMRRIVDSQARRHVDIGSLSIFVSLLSAVIPVDFVDIRPLPTDIPGLTHIPGDILALPHPDASVSSLSCLHVAEHIGLGRYGDALDPLGTHKAAAELARILAPGGNLFLGLPIGRQRTCFNAHRILAPSEILGMFAPLTLKEFSVVDDRGSYLQNQRPESYATSRYACGLFWFHRSDV